MNNRVSNMSYKDYNNYHNHKVNNMDHNTRKVNYNIDYRTML